jgi:hypothetical protein
MWGAGQAKGFVGQPPADLWGWYTLSTMAVNLALLLVQQGLSLLVVNQMVSLSVGLVGALIGLFSLSLPRTFQRFVLWSYYGVLMNVRMDWDPPHGSSSSTGCPWIGPGWPGGHHFLRLYLVIRTLFVVRRCRYMFIRTLYAERLKLRHSPVWLAFLALPLLAAIMGTVNYLQNLAICGWVGTVCGRSTPCSNVISLCRPSSACTAPISVAWST